MALEFTLVYRWHSALPDPWSIRASRRRWRRRCGTIARSSSAVATRIGLFNTPDFLIGAAELPSIQLGRDAQMASYNDYREMCGFPRVTAFDQIIADVRTQRELERLYGNVDGVEFYIGLYAEDVRSRSALPPLSAGSSVSTPSLRR